VCLGCTFIAWVGLYTSIKFLPHLQGEVGSVQTSYPPKVNTSVMFFRKGMLVSRQQRGTVVL